MSQERSASIVDFRGLDERATLGKSLTSTTSLDNVFVRSGNVIGRRGIALWDSISAAATNVVIGLHDFWAPASGTASLIRMQTLALEKWNSGTHAWDDITGTALTGTTTTRPSFANMSDEGFMVFTNEGHDRPRKYTGSGNSMVLGGTPPYAKWLCPYKGFLFLFNTSTDGTFGATADSITAYFSDNPDGSWDPCANNIIIYDETAGECLAAEVFGDDLIVFKADGIVQTRFTGGVTRFARRKLDFAQGILAPMSMKKCGEFGVIFLATDRNLYITDGRSVKPLSLNVQVSLRETMTPALAPYVSACVDATHETYHLLYQRNSSTYFDGRLSYNYRTGEFVRAAYTGYEFTRIHAFKRSNVVDAQIVAGDSAKKVYEQENGVDDAGTSVSRYYDLDWDQFGSAGNKWLTGAELVFKRRRDCRVRLSVALDKSSKFQQARTYTLQGHNANETDCRVSYKLKQPVTGSWFKIRIEFLHDSSSLDVELLEAQPIIIGLTAATADTPHRSQPQAA